MHRVGLARPDFYMDGGVRARANVQAEKGGGSHEGTRTLDLGASGRSFPMSLNWS